MKRGRRNSFFYMERCTACSVIFRLTFCSVHFFSYTIWHISFCFFFVMVRKDYGYLCTYISFSSMIFVGQMVQSVPYDHTASIEASFFFSLFCEFFFSWFLSTNSNKHWMADHPSITFFFPFYKFFGERLNLVASGSKKHKKFYFNI